MSGAKYATVSWRFLDAQDVVAAIGSIERKLADGWQLHGGPIALPGERVLQALVKPAVPPQSFVQSEVAAYAAGWAKGYDDDKQVRKLVAELRAERARQAGEDAKP